ncbi:Retrovirus-related Pol polyprotein from transposon RE2 [Vitis vinifera]|uniref:Retrovirus-related Pol polyprotein from transposon RE2 n=1 Tax=Vitis vinifera TaxID=29760 RepID=A0A438BXA3_VITVI|nr:Retrovirus-related Pol polyprotein from transposon RE2 [Vitis vinifera]
MPPMLTPLHGLSPIALLGSLGPHPHPLKSPIVLFSDNSFRRCNHLLVPAIHHNFDHQLPWQAQANVATTIPPNTTWLLDSGASHHVTTDLHNLALHSPFDGTNEIMIGDGSGLPISHTGSTSLTTPSHSFTLSNVLCVPTMKRNLISISQFCKSNNTSLEWKLPPTPMVFSSVKANTLPILLNITHMTEAKPAPTPLATSPILTLQSGTLLSDPTEYRIVVGSLQYLSLTRPDIAYTVNKLCQFMHQPTSDHWNAVKRLLRNKDDFTSTSAYIIYLGHNPISWSSKKQRTVARSSTEVEYRSVASTAAEIRWICSLLTELGVTLPQQPVIYCDNVGATHLCSNPVFHSRMKHVALDYHFIREQVQNGLLRVSHISASDQLADALTKPLARPQFNSLKAKIGLAPRPSILRGHDKDIQSS